MAMVRKSNRKNAGINTKNQHLEHLPDSVVAANAQKDAVHPATAADASIDFRQLMSSLKDKIDHLVPPAKSDDEDFWFTGKHTAEIKAGDIGLVWQNFTGLFMGFKAVIVTEVKSVDDDIDYDGPEVELNVGSLDYDGRIMLFRMDSSGVLQHASNQKYIDREDLIAVDGKLLNGSWDSIMDSVRATTSLYKVKNGIFNDPNDKSRAKSTYSLLKNNPILTAIMKKLEDMYRKRASDPDSTSEEEGAKSYSEPVEAVEEKCSCEYWLSISTLFIMLSFKFSYIVMKCCDRRGGISIARIGSCQCQGKNQLRNRGQMS